MALWLVLTSAVNKYYYIQGVEWILVHRHFTWNSGGPRILVRLVIFEQDLKYKSCRVKKIVPKYSNTFWFC
jgi:hypothetical protein